MSLSPTMVVGDTGINRQSNIIEGGKFTWQNPKKVINISPTVVLHKQSVETIESVIHRTNYANSGNWFCSLEKAMERATDKLIRSQIITDVHTSGSGQVAWSNFCPWQMKCNHLPDSPDTELISLLSIFKVTLPLIKFNPLPLDPGEVFQVSQGQKKFLQNAKNTSYKVWQILRYAWLYKRHCVAPLSVNTQHEPLGNLIIHFMRKFVQLIEKSV